jgi:hypothetical protein
VEGVVDIAESGERLRMGVVCDWFPGWGLTSAAFGATLRWVKADPEAKGIEVKEREGVKNLFPDVVRWDQAVGAEGSWKNEADDAEIVCFEGKGPSATHPVWGLRSLRMVVWHYGKGKLTPPAGWRLQVFTSEHQELGGATETTHVTKVATRLENVPVQPIAAVGIPADLAQVLDRMTPGDKCPAPASLAEGFPRLGADCRQVMFKLPYVKSPTQWVERYLSPKELLLAWDLPATTIKDAPEEVSSLLSTLRMVPFKIRFHLGESAGNALRRREEVVDDKPAKRPREPSVASPHPLSQKKARLESEASSVQDAKEAADPPPEAEGSQGEQPTEGSELGAREARNQKATKSDDAKVPVYLWDDRVAAVWARQHPAGPQLDAAARDRLDRANELMRAAMLRYWKRMVKASFWEWHNKEIEEHRRRGEEPPERNLSAGLAAIQHAEDASWWEWDRGSAPFFWRWDSEFIKDLRDGMAPRFIGPRPTGKKAQRVNPDPAVRAKIRLKFEKFRRRHQLCVGFVEALMDFFDVEKGEDDIRVVFNGTSSGLNDVLSAPWFFLPTTSTMTRTVDVNYWMGDNDFGEMFYNFWLHEDLQSLSGVDVTQLFPEELEDRKALWLRWTRPAMGLKPSPYQSCQGALRMKRKALGEPSDETNVFAWDRVEINVPGSATYRPGRPWISKRRVDGRIASDIHVYVDDGRSTAPDEELTWQASSRFAKIASFLGLQDTPRKRRPPSQRPGAWSGSCVETTDTQVLVSVSQERWDKTRVKIAWMVAEVERDLRDEKGRRTLDRKILESVRGFLVYVSMTYPSMVPYLKGIHQTLETWRSNRDDLGWKIVTRKLGAADAEGPDEGLDVKAPVRAAAAGRFAADLAALSKFTEGKEPPKRSVRPLSTASVVLGFGDASGLGFGYNQVEMGKTKLKYLFGTWKDEISGKPSNFREMVNLVKSVEGGVADGSIKRGTELFIFTDNYVTERAFFRGTSESPDLCALVLRLRLLEMQGHIFLRLIWVAGTRMIAQGADGLSRGDLSNGVMSGGSMLDFIPIDVPALERTPTLRSWLLSWAGPGTTVLEPADWFHKAHKDGHFIWTPPPWPR